MHLLGLASLLFVAVGFGWAAEEPAPVGPPPQQALEHVLLQILARVSRPHELRALLRKATVDNEKLVSKELQQSALVCDADLARWAKAVFSGETWALQMLDSASKLVTGVLYGDLADLGNFDECVTATPGSLDVGDDFAGRYALPSLQIQRRNSSDSLLTLPALHIPQTRLPRFEASDTSWESLITLQMAFCAPSTCSPEVLEAALQFVLQEFDTLISNLGVRLELSLPANQTSLHSGWRKPTPADWTVVSICLIVLAIVVLATTIDLSISSKSSARSGLGLILAFSAWTNGRRLLSVSPASDTNFTCINGIRFLSVLWVILGHRYRFALDVPFTNLIEIPKRISDNYLITIIPNAILSVDSFFVVGGMMNAYAFFRTVRRTNSFNILEYYVHRYLRLTPALAIMIGITATWISLLGNGPLWYKTAGAANQGCEKYWWSTLLYVANYVNPSEQCMMQSWYLMVDMQLYWLSPLALVPLWKRRRLGLLWMFFLIAVSCAVPFGLSFMYDFRAPIPLNINDADKQREQMAELYYPTHMRTTAYLVGMLAGYYLHEIKSGRIKRGITTFQVALGWFLSTAICLTVIIGSQPLYDIEGTTYNKLASAFYIGFSRLAWGVSLSWIVLACITGHGAPVDAILSWAPFGVLGRLTYGIYLTHAAVQIVDVGTMRTSDYYSDFKMVERMFSDASIAIVLGAALCLTFESPIMKLEKYLKCTSKKSRKKSFTPGDGAEADGKVVAAASAPTATGEEQGQENPAFTHEDGSIDTVWQLPRVRLQSCVEV